MRRHGLALTGLLLAGVLFPVSRPVRPVERLSCPSRGLSAALDASGFRIGPSGWGLSPSSWGRGGRMERMPRVAPRREGERVRYERSGILEWHEARSEGIEQGFEIHSRPPGTGPLVVEQTVQGGLEVLEATSGGIVFGRGGRPLMAYQDLKAFDARGRALPARMRLDGTRLALEVEDVGAAYPVSIDPLSTTAAWVTEPDQASAQYGIGLNTAGDVNGDGYSDVIVGADLHSNGVTQEGRVYVYHGGAGGLSTTAAWVVESNQESGWMGTSVSTAGDVNADGYSDVVVGARRYGNGQGSEGRAWVYHGSASGLSTTAAWVAEPNSASYYGQAVSTAGDVDADGYSDVCVCAPYYSNGVSYEGRAYVYRGGLNGLSTTAAWVVESNQESAFFGSSVSTAGDVNGDGFSDLVVGAYLYSNGEEDEGRAYVYHGNSSGLSTTAAWVAESDQSSAFRGYFRALSTAGDVNGDGYSDVVLGAYNYANGTTFEGRAWVYHGSASGLSTTAAWIAEPNVASYFGIAVSAAGDLNGDGYSDVSVCASYWTNGESYEGRAFVYHGGANGLSTTAAWKAESNQASAFFGTSVSTAGDVNGDGLSDLVVGAYLYSNGENDEGRAYVYHGNEGTVTRNTYNLPGFRSTNTPDPGDASMDSPGGRVVRDSNGFWYVLWTTGDDKVTLPKPILLSYTTTSTPTAATDWATITLVDSAASGVIQAAYANNMDGYHGRLAMGTDDTLQVMWDLYGGDECAWTKCTDLSAITSASSWVTPISSSGTGIIYHMRAFALDSDNVAHVIGTDDDPWVIYTKYDTATTAFLPWKTLAEPSAISTMSIAVDLDNNVYVTWADTYTVPYNISLLCSTNAYTTSPANSVWKNLAQTTTVADTVNSASTTLDAYTAAELCVDMNNIVHVAWRVAPGNGDNSQRIAVRDGRINVGWSGSPALISTPGPWKRPVAMTATGDGKVQLFTVANGGSKRDSVYATTYTGPTVYATDGSWGTATAYSDLAAGSAQALWVERRMWRNRTEGMWFVANDAQRRLSTSWTDRATSSAGVRPPTPTKNRAHPHLSWWFPSTHQGFPSAFASQMGPPVVAHASKGSVYFGVGTDTNGFGVYAVDRSRGALARSLRTSVTSGGTVNNLTGATWGGNVHLFLGSTYFSGGQDKASVRAYVDDGSNVVADTGWSSNPRVLEGSDTVITGPPAFITQGGTRYLWMMASDDATRYQIFKIKADNGIIAGNYGTTVFGSWTEPPTRILNDQIFFPDFTAGLLRREVDGTAEIASSAISVQVLHLLQVRGTDNNRLFVAPEDAFVYQLDSGLKTVGWASGKSVNMGVSKTSGAYYSRAKNFIYVGAGNQLYRLNAGDGNLLSNWPMATTGSILTLPVQWTTFVYFGTSTGRIYAVNATTNVARANWPVVLDVSTDQVKWSAFDAVTNVAYFTTDQGRTYKFSLE